MALTFPIWLLCNKENVICYDFPDNATLFTHRIGRTARNGRKGLNINIVSLNDLAYFFDAKPNLGKELSFKSDSSEIEDCSKVNL